MGAKFDTLCQSMERSVSSLSHTVAQTIQVPATKQEGYERKFESNYNQRTIYPCTDHHDRANADVDAFIKTTSALATQRQCDLSEKGSSPTMISQRSDPPDMTLLLASPPYTATRIPTTKHTPSYVPCPPRNDIYDDSRSCTAHAAEKVIYKEHINDAPGATTETPASRFTGVLRKRARSYIVTGIDIDSTEQGLHDFLTYLDIIYKSAKFIYTRRSDSEEQAEFMELVDNLPDGITCRRWMNSSEYKARQERFRKHRDAEAHDID